MEKTYSRRKPVAGHDGKPARARRTNADRSADGKKTYTRRRTSESDESEAPKRRTYTGGDRKEDRRSGEGRSFGERKQYGERKSYGPKKAYGDKHEDGGKKQYGGKRPYGEKKYDGEKRYGARRDGSGKSYSSDRKYVKKEYKTETKPAKVERPENQEFVRLNKFISNSGICSRREADEFIQTGLVTVNGERVTELGRKVRWDDDIRFNGERIKGEQKVYLVMNKPKGYMTTLSDPHADKTVMDLISAEKCPQRIYPVGRLDQATTGVLMFTNDGELTEKLTHPAYGARKIYHAFLDKNLKKADFDAILEGIDLEDGAIHADSLSYVDGDMAQVGIEIHSGRNRIVRRIFEHLGYSVKKLDRVYFAGLSKKALKRGEWRFLTEQEVAKLKMGSFE